MAGVVAADRHVFRGTRTMLVAAAVALLGFLGWGIGLAVATEHAMHAFLAAWAAVVFTALGALVLLAVGYATNARWMSAVRRLQQSIVAALPVLALGLVPILLQLGELYVWADPPGLSEHEAHLLEHKRAYLNPTFFAIRSLVYFAIWIGCSLLLRRWSTERERRHRDGRPLREESANGRERVLSSLMLPLLAITITFAAFDWLMSMDPFWFSAIYGVYVFAGGFLASIALLTLLAAAAVGSGRLGEELTGYHFHALGRLLLAFVVFWAYCAYFQAMLIQIANLPEEVVFFLERIEGGWRWIVYLLILGHFAAPFAFLLLRSIKFVPAAMAAIAVWLLAIHYVDVFWLVLPALHHHGPVPDLLCLSALAAVAGTSVLFACWRQRGRSLLALGDPFLERGLAYRSKS